MRQLLPYAKRIVILEVKKTIIYPASFWLVAFTIPLYSVIQIVFLETIYSHTTNFAGYTKYEGYMLFGTFTMVQTLGYLFFYNRLAEMKGLIRGDSQESFDMILIKPIDAQILATLGRINFGNIAPFFIAIFVVLYGLIHEPQLLTVLNVIAYLVLVVLGTVIFYLTFLCLSILLFWFPDLQMTEALWDAFYAFGQYPSQLYKGLAGVVLNIIIPITLMASIPIDFLLGRKQLSEIFFYIIIVAILFLLSRIFWNIALKKYSSFSS